jgi:hypothetical protein
MDWSIQEPAPARETPLEASWEEVEFLDFLDEAGLLPGPLVESPSTVPRHTITVAGWNPLTESRQAARQRLLQEAACRIDAELGEARARLERIGAVRIPAKVQLDHFDWLAWFQLTDTTYADLTEGIGQQHRQTVERGVKKAAKFLVGPWWGHWLRPAPRGRPRRGPCR